MKLINWERNFRKDPAPAVPEEPADEPRPTSPQSRSPRAMILGALGAVTLGVAVLSVFVTYSILTPRFGGWAVPTVGALDTLWVVFQATEVLAGNNNRRAERVRRAGLALTAALAAIPTTDLILTGDGQFDLAVVLTPIAIVATKIAWWVTLPALGRKVSTTTAATLATERQRVADQLEEMEAKASHRIELLQAATDLEQRVAAAETDYRLSVLTTRQEMTQALHEQAQLTEQTMAQMPLPASVTAIELPRLGAWSADASALAAVTATVGSTRALMAGDTSAAHETVAGATGRGGRAETGTQVNTASADGGPGTGTEAAHGFGTGGTRRRAENVGTGRAVTLEEIAAVEGVATPEPGERLSDTQLLVVLRHLRYRVDPPASYRQAMTDFRDGGFVGSEERVRRAWGALMTREESTEPAPARAGDGEDSDEDSDTEADAEAEAGA